MQTLTLLKICPEIELAHLYEHIYLRQVVRLLKKRKLLNYLDYAYQGKTYHGGFIWVEIILYSEEAKNAKNDIQFLKLSFDNSSIENSLKEIIAEKKVIFSGKDDESAIKYLQQIDATPWCPIEQFGSFDVHNHRRSRRLMWTTSTAARTRQLRCELLFDNSFADSNRELLPLFRIVASAILDNLANELAENNSYLMATNSPKQSLESDVKSGMIFRIWQKAEPEWFAILSTCKTGISDMLNAEFVSKTQQFLRGDTVNQEQALIDELDIYENSSILIGKIGWQAITTKDNIRSILKHTTLKLTKGRESRVLQIADFL
ncbi:MAG: hypothetical protein PVI21_01315 [Candidatus Woesebacteria bacterium]|jgi:hypothetical protein